MLRHLIILASLFFCGTNSSVIVTGAAGRTGSLVFQRLLALDKSPIGVVRTEKSKQALCKKLRCSSDSVIVVDINDADSIKKAFIESGADKMVLCTSAVPQIKPFSILKTLVLKIFGKTSRPEFKFREKGSPYFVDWLGAKYQYDAAKAARMKQVVVVGSMGGSQPENFLNTIGRVEGDELSGNILLWKRRNEEYLISSGLTYCIIHPGGLLDKPSGEREIILGNDDKLLTEKTRSIPRGDVAEVCVQALDQPGALKRSFDIISREPAPGSETRDWKKFFSQGGNNKY